MNLSHIHVEYPFTYGLMALITLVYFGTMGNPQIADNLLFSSFQIRKNKQYYRILSPALIHGGIIHLVMNGIGIYYFGPVIEQFFGAFWSWIIFILAVAGGSLLPLWVRREELNYQAVGASGGVSGLIMVGMFLYPDMQIGLMLFPVMIPAWIFGIIYTLGSIVLTQTTDRNRISHEGHLGGLLFGGMFAHYFLPSENLGEKQMYMWYFAILPIVLFVIAQSVFPQYFYKRRGQ